MAYGEYSHLEAAYEDANGDPHGIGSPEWDEGDGVEEETRVCIGCGADEEVEICECPDGPRYH
jgi:hypothetical protein